MLLAHRIMKQHLLQAAKAANRGACRQSCLFPTKQACMPICAVLAATGVCSSSCLQQQSLSHASPFF